MFGSASNCGNCGNMRIQFRYAASSLFLSNCIHSCSVPLIQRPTFQSLSKCCFWFSVGKWTSIGLTQIFRIWIFGKRNIFRSLRNFCVCQTNKFIIIPIFRINVCRMFRNPIESEMIFVLFFSHLYVLSPADWRAYFLSVLLYGRLSAVWKKSSQYASSLVGSCQAPGVPFRFG